VPALKPMVVKVFPKMLLSDLYARSRKAYGSSGTGSASRPGTTSNVLANKHHPSHPSRGGSRGGSKGGKSEIHVTVQQSFEMRSLPENDDEDTIPIQSNAVLTGKGSPHGSERQLVTAQPAWEATCYSTNGNGSTGLGRQNSGRKMGRAYGPYGHDMV
jgi:hypothetical protein